MLTRKLIIAALLAAGTIGAAAAPASAATTYFESSYGTPVHHEYDGRHRPDHVWVPGHRTWDGYRRAWVPGHWERERGYRGYGHRGYAQNVPPRWDRDGDGVANRYDARPDNPYRY